MKYRSLKPGKWDKIVVDSAVGNNTDICHMSQTTSRWGWHFNIIEDGEKDKCVYNDVMIEFPI